MSLSAPTRRASPRTLVLFGAHETSDSTLSAFRHLCSTAGPNVEVRMQLDVAHGAPIPEAIRGLVDTFDSRDFAQWGLPTFGPKMLPGHCHYPVLRAFARRPDVEHLWFVEYDVCFTGRWRRLFDHYLADDADLLACDLRDFDDEPTWHWWPSFQLPAPDAHAARMAAFLICARYSARAAATLLQCHREGWTGHFEGIVPTALRQRGLRIRDLNGAAWNCEPRPDPGFYGRDTVRYRPAKRRAGWRWRHLYHPVKPNSMLGNRTLMERLRSRALRVLSGGK
ncbi:MAG: hypothetical protein O9284_17940 [Steroidobacteraceae bacterium]|nr:hypothetical protein [Steroidobacteraceae bacterium]